MQALTSRRQWSGRKSSPSVTKYEVKPAVGVRVNRISNLADDLALALAAKDVRIEAPIPGEVSGRD